MMISRGSQFFTSLGGGGLWKKVRQGIRGGDIKKLSV